MKKNVSLILVIVASFGLLLSSIVGQEQADHKTQSSFSNLTLKLTVDKREFLPFEPISLNVSVTNETSTPVLGHSRIQFVNKAVKLLVTNTDGETKEISQLSLKHEKVPRIKNTPIQPGQSYEAQEVFFNLHNAFRQTGAYKIQAVLKDMEWREEIRSAPITIEIYEPTGADLEAYKFVQEKIGDNPFFFAGYITTKQEKENVFERLSNQFGETVYGDYGAYLAGVNHLTKGNYELAESYLRRALQKEGFAFKENANKMLVQIDNLRARNKVQ